MSYVEEAARWYMWKQYAGAGIGLLIMVLMLVAWLYDWVESWWRGRKSR